MLMFILDLFGWGREQIKRTSAKSKKGKETQPKNIKFNTSFRVAFCVKRIFIKRFGIYNKIKLPFTSLMGYVSNIVKPVSYQLSARSNIVIPHKCTLLTKSSILREHRDSVPIKSNISINHAASFNILSSLKKESVSSFSLSYKPIDVNNVEYNPSHITNYLSILDVLDREEKYLGL